MLCSKGQTNLESKLVRNKNNFVQQNSLVEIPASVSSSVFSPVLARSFSDSKTLTHTTYDGLKSSTVFSPVLSRNFDDSKQQFPDYLTDNKTILNSAPVCGSTVFSPLYTTNDPVFDEKSPSIAKLQRRQVEICSYPGTVSANIPNCSIEIIKENAVKTECKVFTSTSAIGKFADVAVQTESCINTGNDQCSSGACSSGLNIQADFIKSVLESCLEELEDRRRFEFQKFYSQYIWDMQMQTDKMNQLLKMSSTIDRLVNENDRLRQENEKLRFLRFGR